VQLADKNKAQLAEADKDKDKDKESLEDDALVSVDDDEQSFTLNECAHLCALLNDLHLQVC
jgi:hypothetical protein